MGQLPTELYVYSGAFHSCTWLSQTAISQRILGDSPIPPWCRTCEHHVVPGADHGYDGEDDDRAREVYALIARQVQDATSPT